RVFLDETKNALVSRRKFQMGLVDVRSPKEFTGEILAPPEYPTEHTQRGGHIPSAINIPWAQVVNDSDGTFKSIEQLKQLYESNGITKDRDNHLL
ncbi:MAG TPA: rhodanese-like domain-containing protein, partial [Nitrososphaeraceae archaeon]|nr:rhodanese-like domain-containing protein [Nitrososphaeraceae archaeon]